VLVFASLPSGTVITVALNAVVSAAEGAPRVEASTQGLVHAETQPRDRYRRWRRSQAHPQQYQMDTAALRLTWGLSLALPFTLDVFDARDKFIEVLGRIADLSVAQAAFEAAVAKHPDKRICLRQMCRVIRSSDSDR
jgi:hypothetical protein